MSLFWRECTLCEAEAAKRIELEDEVRELRAKLQEVTDELAKSRAETNDSIKHVADWMSQSLFGRKIYAATPDLPEKSITPEVVPQKAQARRLVNQLEKEFFERFEHLQ
jgi:hypothetical protein